MKTIKINRIIRVSPKTISKEGNELYFVDFEGAFITEDVEEVNSAVKEAIKRTEEFLIK